MFVMLHLDFQLDNWDINITINIFSLHCQSEPIIMTPKIDSPQSSPFQKRVTPVMFLVSPVACHLSLVTSDSSHSHRPSNCLQPNYAQKTDLQNHWNNKKPKNSRGMTILVKHSWTRSLQSTWRLVLPNDTDRGSDDLRTLQLREWIGQEGWFSEKCIHIICQICTNNSTNYKLIGQKYYPCIFLTTTVIVVLIDFHPLFCWFSWCAKNIVRRFAFGSCLLEKPKQYLNSFIVPKSLVTTPPLHHGSCWATHGISEVKETSYKPWPRRSIDVKDQTNEIPTTVIAWQPLTMMVICTGRIERCNCFSHKITKNLQWLLAWGLPRTSLWEGLHWLDTCNH